MREFEKNISVNVIATFYLDQYNEQQEIFDIKHIWKIALKDKKHLMNYIKRQLDPHRKLVKLSLCWSCSKYMVNKYSCINNFSTSIKISSITISVSFVIGYSFYT